MDFRVGRMQEPEPAMLKEALKQARGTEERTKKNVSMDVMGDKIGRIHLGKLDLGDLQTRKMKGLKRGRDEALGEARGDDDDDESVDDGESSKRRK